jgi:colicin import membrane protein
METELVTIPPQATALTMFTSDGGKDLEPLLAEVREKIDSWTCPGTDTKRARDEIASFAFKVVRSKTALEKVGKALAAEAKLIPGKIDASRRRINTTLDAWAAEVRAPLDAWEVAEDARIKRHREKVDHLNAIVAAPMAGTSASMELLAIRNQIALVEAIVIGPVCEEFEAEYARAKDAALRALRTALADRERYDAEQAELSRLRAQEAEREAARKKEAEAAAVVERERLAREREDRAAAEAVENERRRAEQEQLRARHEAERAAERERQDAERRERELREQAEAAERRAAEAEARAKREAAQAVADAKKREEEQRAAERAEAERRENNKRIAAAVNRKARDALMAGGLAEDAAELAVRLIASRKVPAVTISY